MPSRTRLGPPPWERHATATRTSTAAILDREEAARSRPLGRAIDVGCGRGLYTCELATRGWQAVGIDFVPRAINAASRRGDCGASFVVGDVTDLASGDLGTFDLFLDIGCFQGLRPEQQLAEGRGVSALANPGATLLVLAFQPDQDAAPPQVGRRGRMAKPHSLAGRSSRSSPPTPPGWGGR